MFINQYYPPDTSASAYLLGELTEDLARDHEVTVVAGRPSYSATAGRYRPRGVSIQRSWSTAFARERMAGRLANYLSFLASATARAMLPPRPDVVVALTDPPAVGIVGILAARRHGVPFVYVCQDIFPEVAIALGKLSVGASAHAWTRLNRFLRRSATRIVVIGRDMREKLKREGVEESKLSLIRNWASAEPTAHEDAVAARRRLGWDDRFVLMHAGNLGLAQSPSTLVDMAVALRSRMPDLLLVFLGDGASKAALQRRVQEERIENVTFLAHRPKHEAQRLMEAADLHVVSLAPGLLGCVAPSKTYGIMAAGRPFIAAVERGSEPALLANEHGCGLVVDPGDETALADALVRARELPLDDMGRRGREAFEAAYDRSIATDAYRRLLEEVVAESRPG